MESRLTFLKCFFCCKNFNKLQLIDLNNSVLINEEELSYINLIFDICFLKIDDKKVNYICSDCNDKLLSFHFFKRDTKKYNTFREHLEKLEILSKAEAFLDEAGNLEGVKVTQDNYKLTISLPNDLIAEENIAQDLEVLVDYKDDLMFECNFEDTQTEDLEVDQEPQAKNSSYYKTNKDVTAEELEWIKSAVSSSEIKRGQRSFYKCSVCSVVLSTSASLLRHLRDVHVLVENAAEVAMEEEQRAEFRAEIRSSRSNIVTEDGSESIWKCERCEEKPVYKSEQAFRLHLRTTHLKPTKDEASLIADCKVNDATGEENSIVWNCPYCEDIECKTRESFIYHIKSAHPEQDEDSSTYIGGTFDDPQVEVDTEELLLFEYTNENLPMKKRKLNTLNDLNEDQINWLRKEVAAGQVVNGKKKSFKCTVCGCILSTQASLTRHLRDVHVLQQDKDRTTFKQEVNRSKLRVGNETIWKCQRCENDQIYKSEQSFKTHLRMKHIRSTKVDTAFVAACKTTVREADGLRDVWKCPKCLRIFRHRDSLRNHIKIEHPDMDEEETKKRMEVEKEAVPTFVDHSDEVISRIALKLESKEIGKSTNFCNECGLKFATSKQHLKPKVHRESHEAFKILAPQISSYKCEPCRMVFNSEASYNQHMMVHDSPENIVLIAAEGLAQFGASTYKIPKGDADDAVDEAVWKCGHCPVRYFEESDCLTHIMLLHSSPLCCFLDNREFGGSTGLSKYLQHMKNKHPELFPDLTYPCGSCKLEFPSIYEKLAHQKLCSSKKFECDHCEKRFQTKYQLQFHLLYELGLSGVSCEFCGKRCKSMSDLKIHQNVHSLARPYECSLCSKTFKTPAARSTHMESHNGGVDCEICGVNLSSRSLYQRHKRFQHNLDFRDSQHEKNVCTLCEKSFLRASHFKQHMKHQHGIQQV